MCYLLFIVSVVLLVYSLVYLPFRVSKSALYEATNSTVVLCISDHSFPALSRIVFEQPLSMRGLSEMRAHLRSVLTSDFQRTDDMLMASGEAAINAIKYGGGGYLTLYLSPTGYYIKVSDHGKGIPRKALISAVLRDGYSLGKSAGLGFSIITKCCDHVWLRTSPRGTTLLMQIDSKPVDLLDQFEEGLLAYV